MLKDPGRTVKVTSQEVSDVAELSCKNHEEADTRVFSHLWYAVQNYNCQRVVLRAIVTDTIIMAFVLFS